MSPWWRDGVLYQVYPRSFQDSTGDGHGDLQGIIDRLDHLAWLGVDGVWLNPTFPSPNADWGYDVSDYTGVHPDFGTHADLDRLIAAAGERGIRVLLDLVPNHTSDQHPWFTEHPDRYVWADEIPNDWTSIFDGTPAWTRHANGRYYLRLFAPEQPDLDWWNPDVPAAFDEILRFWLDRGVAGFRIDVCQAIVKDRALRDPGPQPEVHDVLRRWRATTEAVLVGETYVYELDELVRYYGDGEDELHMAFNIPFLKAELSVEEMRPIVERMEAEPTVWPTWAGSNHDLPRMASRWGNPRLALMLLLTLRGTPFLYYGDEIGLEQVAVTDLRDKAGGRDGCRTPMPWPGFTTGEPWLPMGEQGTSVAEQREDPDSILHLTRDLIAVRKAFVGEPYATLESPAGVWAYSRGDHRILLNFSAATMPIEGTVVRATQAVGSELPPGAGAIVT
ncbi:MAG: alpha-glucosidase [Solirubrobacteraceae bacterium]|jgi:alpha-glucosidase|nr:alpha-glucosidase [Solirubrobacteraceae bacterium]